MSASPLPVPRGKRLCQNLALAFGSFLGCVVALEIGLRLCGYGNLEIYEPDPKLFWRLKPNQDCYTKIGHQPVHINSHGTRGPEFETAKPANTVRILSLGDSRTFGWGLAESDTYSALLQQQLQERAGPSKRIEVINAGVNAWSYPQMRVYFREVGLKCQPDIVLLAEANLWTQFSERSSAEFVKQFMARVRVKNFLRRFAIYHFFIEVQLKEFYERHRTRFIPVDPKQDALFKTEQQADPDAVFRSAIEGLCREAQTNGVKPVLIFLPTRDDLAATNRSGVLESKRRVSAALQVPLVDLTGELQPGGNALYLEGDPVHLNARGNERVARRLFVTLTNLVAP